MNSAFMFLMQNLVSGCTEVSSKKELRHAKRSHKIGKYYHLSFQWIPLDTFSWYLPISVRFPVHDHSWHVSSQHICVSFLSSRETFIVGHSLFETADRDQTSAQLWRLRFTSLTRCGRAVFHPEALLSWPLIINSSDTSLMWHDRGISVRSEKCGEQWRLSATTVGSWYNLGRGIDMQNV
jgi:hypothetical protein